MILFRNSEEGGIMLFDLAVFIIPACIMVLIVWIVVERHKN